MAESKHPTVNYTSSEFIESTGAILFHTSQKKICLVHSPSRNEWLLPKGRRNVSETRQQAAIREVQEETGFPCKLLPVTLRTRCTPNAVETEFTPDKPRLYERVMEPFMLTHRVLPDGQGLKLIWWYIGGIDESAAMLKAEDTYSAELFGFQEAVTMLTFESDRVILRRAIEIYEESYGFS